MKSISIIVYLNSGGISGKSRLANLQNACRENNIDYTIHISQYPKHTKKLISEVVKNNTNKEDNRIVVVGGDGTLNEAITGLVIDNLITPIAYFPSGTGNDFARSLGLTNDANKFLKEIFAVPVANLEIITAQDNISKKQYVAVNGIGFGFDALVSHLNDKSRVTITPKLKRLAYLSKIMAACKEIKPYSAKIVVNSTTTYNYDNIFFVSFMKNNYFGGGIKIDPFNNQNNGEIGLILARNVKKKNIPHMMYHILGTGKQFEKTNTMKRIAGETFNIQIAGSQYLQADGEVDVLEGVDMDIRLSNYPFYLVKK